MSRLAAHTVWALLALAGVLVVLLAIGPWLGGWRVATVLSNSMQPAFSAGDLLVMTPAPRSSVREGDVITFEAPGDRGSLVTHRVVKVVQGGEHPLVRTRGDANSVEDTWHLRLDEGPLWKQQAALPKLGLILRFLRSPGLREVLVWVLPAILLVLAVRDAVRILRPHHEDEWEFDETFHPLEGW